MSGRKQSRKGKSYKKTDKDLSSAPYKKSDRATFLKSY